MGNVINLASFRQRSRKAYMAKYEAKLNRLVEGFVHSHLDFDFRQVAHDYQNAYQEAGSGAAMEASWDYVHFREILADALDEVFGTAVYDLVSKEYWFDPQMITREEVIDRCLSAYIMQHCDYGEAYTETGEMPKQRL